MKKTRILIFVSLLIAMEVILTRFFSIQTPIIRIGFGFLPVALSAITFGPLIGGITAALADIIGMIIFPVGGAYFPGFTLSALLSGVIYGLLLYQKPKSVIRISIAVLIITLFIDLGLNTLWLSLLTGKGVIVLIGPRMVKSSIMYPVQVFAIHATWYYAGNYMKRIGMVT